VFLRDGTYVCMLCGATIEIPPGKRPLVIVKAASGRPNLRAIVLDGKELHA